MQRLLDRLCEQFPGLQATLINDSDNQPLMPPFEVSHDSLIVKAVNEAYQRVRGEPQPTGIITPPAYFGTDAAHFYQRLGMQGVVCGPGGEFNTMPDERVHKTDYLTWCAFTS
ncbi:M20/M25/M40 family metallo-hydrolase [Pseudomonas thivervalensis]|uniref:M20/M25/M40 family metallo-hydrolase n=1 Tax=Pseudomonas thivervalensis TaxID=86265 RepID=UPI001C9A2D0C|nr:M20/M25/M40 family metallo-hydrolase [Pseudomonas thivervalensis]